VNIFLSGSQQSSALLPTKTWGCFYDMLYEWYYWDPKGTEDYYLLNSKCYCFSELKQIAFLLPKLIGCCFDPCKPDCKCCWYEYRHHTVLFRYVSTNYYNTNQKSAWITFSLKKVQELNISYIQLKLSIDFSETFIWILIVTSHIFRWHICMRGQPKYCWSILEELLDSIREYAT